MAYVTLLCSDAELAPARVVVYSLRRSKTSHPVVVLALPKVSSEARAQLTALGAIVRDTPWLPLDDRRLDGSAPSLERRCRLQKLSLWSLGADYDRVVYVDVTMMVIAVSSQHFVSNLHD
jgi:hypothetical protein